MSFFISVLCYYINFNDFFNSLFFYMKLPLNNSKFAHTHTRTTDVETYNLCMSDKTIMTIQILASVVILTIITSLFAFTLDVLAPRKYPFWKVVKRHAFGHVVTGLLLLLLFIFLYIIFFCYLSTIGG